MKEELRKEILNELEEGYVFGRRLPKDVVLKELTRELMALFSKTIKELVGENDDIKAIWIKRQEILDKWEKGR
jgi:hypothetical protein